MNRQLANPLILPRNAERLRLDLLAYLAEIREALVEVEELAVFGVGGAVDELEDERAAGDDALAAGEEVAADDAARCMLVRDEGGGGWREDALF